METLQDCLNRAERAMVAAQYATAVEGYRAGALLAPDNADVFFNLGIALQHANSLLEAGESYRRAFSLGNYILK